jgi:hypothetical protein
VLGLCQTYHWVSNHFGVHLVALLGDVGHMEFNFGPFRDSVYVGARYMNGLRKNAP